MGTTKRKKPGIRWERSHWRAYVWLHGQTFSCRFPADTPDEEMEAWQARIRSEELTTPQPVEVDEAGRPIRRRRTLKADVERYLTIVHTMPTIATRTQHMTEWVQVLKPTRDRRMVTPAEIAAQLARWKKERHYAGSTLNHRRNALAHFYRTIDPAGPNPARAVAKFREPTAEPRGLSPHVATAILDALAARDTKRAGKGQPGGSAPSRTAAHLRVMATTGLPPATIARLQPEHLADLDRAVVLVPGRQKGRGTATMRHQLTELGVAALTLFQAIGAWGPVPSSTRLIVWRRALVKVRAEHPDWPIRPDCKPYDLRHSFGEAVYRATHDLALTQGLLGHLDQRTTRRYVAGAIPAGEAAAAARVTLAWREDVRTHDGAQEGAKPPHSASPPGKRSGKRADKTASQAS